MSKQMIIKVKQDPETKDNYLDLEDFKSLVDISKVHSYSLRDLENGSLIIEFFDKEGVLLKINNDGEQS